jgi:hypothetical protein
MQGGQTSTPSWPAWRRTSARRSGRSGARWRTPASPFAHCAATAITQADWDFFYRCYERTYREHGNPPYLTRDFFRAWRAPCPRTGCCSSPSAAASRHRRQPDRARRTAPTAAGRGLRPLLGRAGTGRLPALRGLLLPAAGLVHRARRPRFEGGAQGEHKMARALMPVKTHSAHWLAHPAFADAVERFLEREGEGIESTWTTCRSAHPFKSRRRGTKAASHAKAPRAGAFLNALGPRLRGMTPRQAPARG